LAVYGGGSCCCVLLCGQAVGQLTLTADWQRQQVWEEGAKCLQDMIIWMEKMQSHTTGAWDLGLPYLSEYTPGGDLPAQIELRAVVPIIFDSGE